MKILQVNKFYYPRGGADKYFLELTHALEKAGHEVAVFSMAHPKNLPTPWSSYFVSRVSFNSHIPGNKLKIPGRVLYSVEAKNKFRRLLRDFQPDIIHIHNIYHHISPSILDAAREKNIPVVMHLHDYKLICPNHTLFTKGAYCEQCRPNKYRQCLKNRCVKDSLFGSALIALEMYLHHSIMKIYEKNIALFIAPSRFMKEAAIRFGQNKEKIKIIYNSYSSELKDKASAYPAPQEDYLLYFGRLSQEKGIDTLIRAVALTDKKLKIAGSGSEEDNLKRLAAELKASVEFLGFKENIDLKPLIIGAKAVIIPSVWAENMPLNLLEALSLGKIVLASRIGGLPEVIQEGINGLLFEPGNPDDLAKKIKEIDRLDGRALEEAIGNTVTLFTPEKNIAAVLAVYEKLTEK